MLADKPLLSIVIPIYNTSKYLEACLNSIRLQVFENYEVLMVDDGSTDSSAEIAGNYVAIDSRFKLLRKANGGQASARNIALEVALGKYLTFVDSDDELLDIRTYSNAIAILEQDDTIDIVHFPYFKIFHDGRREQGTCSGIDCNVTLSNKKEYFENIEVVTDYMKLPRILSSGQWDKIFRATVFEGIRYEPGRLFEDTYITCDLFTAARSIVLTPIGAYGYYERPSSTTTSRRSLKVYQDQLDSQIRVLHFLIQSGGDNDAIKTTINALSRFIIGVYAEYGIRANLSSQNTSLYKCACSSGLNGFWSAIHRMGLYHIVARMFALVYIIKKRITK